MAPNRQPEHPQQRQRGTPLSDAQEDVLKSVTDHEDDDDSNKDIRRNEEDDDNDEDDAGDDDTAPVADQDDDDDEDDQPPRRKEPGDDDDDDEDDQRRRAATDEEDEDDPDKNFQYRQNRNGDILDVDGKLLFAKGRPRNAWTKLKKAWRQQTDNNRAVVQHAQALATAGRELLDKYKALQLTANQGKTLGLTDKETKDALDLAAMAKTNPKQAVQTILTRLSLGGTDLSSIGVTGPVDPKEVARHVVEQQELARQTRLEDSEKAAKAEAKEVLQNFLIANSDAGPYLGMIAKAKTDWPHLSLEQIWYQLKKSARAAARRGNGRNGDDPDRRDRNFREPPPRNNSRDHRGGRKLSLKAVDPTQSYKQIGRDLLAELQRNEKE